MKEEKNILVNISLRTLVYGLLLGLLVLVLYLLRDLVLVLLTSIVIASFVSIATHRFKKGSIWRTLAVVALYGVCLAILAVVFYLFVPILIVEVSNLSTLLADYLPKSKFITILNSDAFSGAKDLVKNLPQNLSLADFVANSKALVSSVSGGFFDTLTLIFGGVVNFVLIIVISFYLSMQEEGITNFLRIVVPPKYEEYAIGLWERSQKKIALWIQGQLLLGLLIGVLIYLGLSIFQVKYALLLAIIAAILELVPFGMILATVPAVAFAYLDSGATQAAIIAIYYFIVQQFEAYLIAPNVVKRVIGISPLMVILSILVGAKLAGFWGIILAIPAAVVLMEFLSDIEKKKVLARAEK